MSAPSTPSNALPHDIYELERYPSFFDWLENNQLFVLTIFCVLLLVLASLFYILRKTKQNKQTNLFIDPLTQLSKNLINLHPREDFFKADYFFQISFAAKQILEIITQVPVTDLTFKEIEERLKVSSQINSDQIFELLAFFKRADMIKFADMPTNYQEAKAYHQMLCQWVKGL